MTKTIDDLTSDEFDELLVRALAEDIGLAILDAERLFEIPGIYEILSEYYNNNAIEIFERENT